MKYSAWQDAIYTTTGQTFLNYNIYDGSQNLLFSGKAYPRPNKGTIDINISQIVRNYLDSKLPVAATSGMQLSVGNYILPNSVKDFTLTDEKGNVLNSYKFLNCWDYDTNFAFIDNVGSHFRINNYINNHLAFGQFHFTTYLLKNNTVRVSIVSVGNHDANTCGYGAFYYSNALGGWDDFLIEVPIKKKYNYERYDIRNNAIANSLEFGDKTINNTIEESWEFKTQYLTDDESKTMTTHLFGSNDVYFHSFEDDMIYPVILTDNSVEVKTIKNQGRKMFQYTIKFKNSQQKQRI